MRSCCSHSRVLIWRLLLWCTWFAEFLGYFKQINLLSWPLIEHKNAGVHAVKWFFRWASAPIITDVHFLHLLGRYLAGSICSRIHPNCFIESISDRHGPLFFRRRLNITIIKNIIVNVLCVYILNLIWPSSRFWKVLLENNFSFLLFLWFNDFGLLQKSIWIRCS